MIVIGNRGEVTINPRDLMARRASVRGIHVVGAHRGGNDGNPRGSVSPAWRTARFARSSARRSRWPKRRARTRKSWSPGRRENRSGPVTRSESRLNGETTSTRLIEPRSLTGPACHRIINWRRSSVGTSDSRHLIVHAHLLYSRRCLPRTPPPSASTGTSSPTPPSGASITPMPSTWP